MCSIISLIEHYSGLLKEKNIILHRSAAVAESRISRTLINIIEAIKARTYLLAIYRLLLTYTIGVKNNAFNSLPTK